MTTIYGDGTTLDGILSRRLPRGIRGRSEHGRTEEGGQKIEGRGERTKLNVQVLKSREIDTSENWSAGAMQGKEDKGREKNKDTNLQPKLDDGRE